MSNILETFVDPRGKNIVLYESTWETHIIENHPEMEDEFESVKDTIEDPDIIKEGRDPEKEELYIKYESMVNPMCVTCVFVSTRDIEPDITIITTAFIGEDNPSKGKTKWKKSK